MKTVFDNNIDNLKILIEKYGSQNKLAELIDKSPSQISQWVSGYRAIGHKSARAIEKKLNLPDMWMDADMKDLKYKIEIIQNQIQNNKEEIAKLESETADALKRIKPDLKEGDFNKISARAVERIKQEEDVQREQEIEYKNEIEKIKCFLDVQNKINLQSEDKSSDFSIRWREILKDFDNLDDLDGGINTGNKDSNVSAKGDFELWSRNSPLSEDEYVHLPFYKDIRLAGGAGSLETEDANGFKLPFSKASLHRSGVSADQAVCFTVKGNSMSPVLREGTTVGVDMNRKNIKDGEAYAFYHDDMLRIKLLYRLPGQKVKIRSYNREEFEDEIVDASEIEIIGELFWWSFLK